MNVEARPATSGLEEIAQTGDANSQYRLGMRYTNGREFPQNHAEAVAWFTRAAEQGHAEAQFMLGAAYAAGRGVAQDREASLRWFRRAAHAGHMRAQYQLGEAYSHGHGVMKDLAWGARWYGMAANQGHSEAQFLLAAFYSAGLGLPKSYPRSIFWLQVAVLGGHPQAPAALASMRQKVSAAQYREITANVKRWQPVAMRGYENAPTITYIQHVLGQLAYPAGPVDGILGVDTLQAIMRFQANQNLGTTLSLERSTYRLRERSPGLNQ